MNAVAPAPPPKIENQAPAIAWFPVAVFSLVWLEVISRLRFEWSINPQYGYGWAVPVLAAYIFWRRWQNAPAPAAPRASVLWTALIVIGALMLVPVRLIQEANPDWRLLSWAMALCAVAISAAGIYLAGGARWLRHFAFPILFFLVAVPWPTSLEQILIQRGILGEPGQLAVAEPGLQRRRPRAPRNRALDGVRAAGILVIGALGATAVAVGVHVQRPRRPIRKVRAVVRHSRARRRRRRRRRAARRRTAGHVGQGTERRGDVQGATERHQLKAVRRGGRQAQHGAGPRRPDRGARDWRRARPAAHAGRRPASSATGPSHTGRRSSPAGRCRRSLR